MSATTTPRLTLTYHWDVEVEKPSLEGVQYRASEAGPTWLRVIRAEHDGENFTVSMVGPGARGLDVMHVVDMTAQQPEWLVVLMADALDRLRR